MINIPSPNPQKFGTNMISTNGLMTNSLYLAFAMEDPVAVDQRRSRLYPKNVDHTGGVVPGQPITEE
jgi:hypothetical protein